MNRKTYDIILFDLDGTIIDPGVGIVNSVSYALNHFGIEVENKNDLYKFIGPPLIDSFMDFYGFDREKAVEAVNKYREFYKVTGINQNHLYDGFEDLLKTLTERGKRILVATSKPEEIAKNILESHGIAKYFEFIAGAEMDESRSKKDEVISYALETCRITDISKIVMVGDRKFDVIGAKQFGMDSIGVLFGYGDKEELEAAGANYICKTVAELKDLLI